MQSQTPPPPVSPHIATQHDIDMGIEYQAILAVKIKPMPAAP